MTTLLGRLFNSDTHKKHFQSKDFQNGFAKGDLKFGLSLMSQLGEGNAVVSPASIRATLGMLYEGAKGPTAEQIAQIGLIPESVNARWSEFKRLAPLLNTPAGRGSLGFANGVWVDQNKTVNDVYDNILRRNYWVEPRLVDFSRELENERTEINRWVAAQTNEKIHDLFSPSSMSPDARIVLANAMYFKTSWVHKFEANLTKKQNFTLSNGETVQVDMMRHYFPEFRYGEVNGNQLVMLPYESHELAMLIVLPPRGHQVKELEDTLIDSNCGSWEFFKHLKPRRFNHLEIPKYEFVYGYDLKQPLMQMGIDRIFSEDDSDLSGVSRQKTCVDLTLHKTYIQNDEEGAEGAAATASRVFTGNTAPPELEFVADRPHLQAVVHQPTGAILALIRIEDPR